MPTYKQRPHVKKKGTQNLPFYRPIDRLALGLIEKRRLLVPFLITGLIFLLLFVGLKAYSAMYEGKAAALLNRGELEVLAKEYGRSRAAQLARMKLGKMALDAKEYERAADWFKPVADDSSALLRTAARQNLALALLKTGETAQAIELLQKASKDPENASADYTELLLARAEEVSGNKPRALEIYKTLAEGSKISAVQQEAQERKRWLDSETQPASPAPRQ